MRRSYINAGKHFLYFGWPGLLAAMLTACTDTQTTLLEEIRERGEIIVVTRNGPSTYYIEQESESGFEYTLARRFAEFLGVNLKTVVAKDIAEITRLLENGQADFAAAAMINNFSADNSLAFGPGFQWVTQQLVYRNGRNPPATLRDIHPDKLDVAQDTWALLPLGQIRRESPELTLNIHRDRDSHEMLELLEEREIHYTITDANEFILARQYYPEIRVAFDITAPQPVAWAYRKSTDLSLLQATWRFYEEIMRTGELAALISQFYTRKAKFDYVDARKFVDRFENRFTPLRPMFESIAGEQGMDWRLLAAMSYQESHWEEEARSPTGVQGLMMLTRDTAKSVGVGNRLNPEQSVRGGMLYLKTLIDKIPARIVEPDRTWMALAAYNVGFGHLEDARILTQRQGGDPDVWLDVKQRLPLLSRQEWYQQTKFGYARGVEPALFVERVRRYYDTLVQLTQPAIPAEQLASDQLVETRLNEGI